MSKGSLSLNYLEVCQVKKKTNTPIRAWRKGYKWEIHTKIYTKGHPH